VTRGGFPEDMAAEEVIVVYADRESQVGTTINDSRRVL
jgi:hypothetical protein